MLTKLITISLMLFKTSNLFSQITIKFKNQLK